MTPPDNTPQVEVTQADRDAALPILGPAAAYALTDHPVLQILARHRLSATPPAQTALVEALEGLSAEVRLLRMAVQADDPKREIMLRVGDIDTATRATLSLATGERS